MLGVIFLFKKKVTIILLSIFMVISTLVFPNTMVKAFGTNGWQQDGTKITYYINGNRATSWISSGGKWYYLDSSGNMLAGTWINYNDKIYYLNSDGDMATGWVLSKVTGMWYYLKPSGEMLVSAWINTGGKYYYLNQDGDMAINTTTPDGYKVGTDGAWDGVGVLKQNFKIGIEKNIDTRLK